MARYRIGNRYLSQVEYDTGMEMGVWFFSCRSSHYRMARTYLSG